MDPVTTGSDGAGAWRRWWSRNGVLVAIAAALAVVLAIGMRAGVPGGAAARPADPERGPGPAAPPPAPATPRLRPPVDSAAVAVFDRDAWLQNGSGGARSRWDMVDDLQANHLTPGLTRPEVKRLLGEPTWTGGELDLWYDLGARPGGTAANGHALVIRFKRTGGYDQSFTIPWP